MLNLQIFNTLAELNSSEYISPRISLIENEKRIIVSKLILFHVVAHYDYIDEDYAGDEYCVVVSENEEYEYIGASTVTIQSFSAITNTGKELLYSINSNGSVTVTCDVNDLPVITLTAPVYWGNLTYTYTVQKSLRNNDTIHYLYCSGEPQTPDIIDPVIPDLPGVEIV